MLVTFHEPEIQLALNRLFPKPYHVQSTVVRNFS